MVKARQHTYPIAIDLARLHPRAVVGTERVVELGPPCAVRQVAAERLEREPDGLVADPLPLHALRRVTVIDGREVDALPVLVRRHELHLAEPRVERGDRPTETFDISDWTVVAAIEIRHLATIPIGPIERRVRRNIHLRSVKPLQQHSGGDTLDRRLEAELAARRRHLHAHAEAVLMPPCDSLAVKHELRRLEPRRFALRIKELERERLRRRDDAFRAVRDKRLDRAVCVSKAKRRSARLEFNGRERRCGCQRNRRRN